MAILVVIPSFSASANMEPVDSTVENIATGNCVVTFFSYPSGGGLCELCTLKPGADPNKYPHVRGDYDCTEQEVDNLRRCNYIHKNKKCVLNGEVKLLDDPKPEDTILDLIDY